MSSMQIGESKIARRVQFVVWPSTDLAVPLGNTWQVNGENIVSTRPVTF